MDCMLKSIGENMHTHRIMICMLLWIACLKASVRRQKGKYAYTSHHDLYAAMGCMFEKHRREDKRESMHTHRIMICILSKTLHNEVVKFPTRETQNHTSARGYEIPDTRTTKQQHTTKSARAMKSKAKYLVVHSCGGGCDDGRYQVTGQTKLLNMLIQTRIRFEY